MLEKLVSLAKLIAGYFFSLSLLSGSLLVGFILLQLYASLRRERPQFFYNKKIARFNKLFEKT
jgi:predicted alpha/beta-fold hydrolase